MMPQFSDVCGAAATHNQRFAAQIPFSDMAPIEVALHGLLWHPIAEQ